MAKIIAISGPAATGKTSIWDDLRHYESMKDVIFIPDIYSTVWNDLIDKGEFEDFTEVSKDPEYLCIYILNLINYYNDIIEKYKDTEKVVIIDGCWIDISIYAIIHMWYMHSIKEVQESILSKLMKFDEYIDTIYLTHNDEDVVRNTPKYHSPFKKYNAKVNRPMELQMYKLYSNFKNVYEIESTEVTEASQYILHDLAILGYISKGDK